MTKPRSPLVKWSILMLVLLITFLAVFYVRYWSALTSLPARVHDRTMAHHGIPVSLNQVTPWFTKGLIATEDRSFYRNWGISFEGIGRALVVDIETGSFAQGGSTLTQQLIRDLLLSPHKTIPRKVTGTLLALMTTVLYSKQQILTMYINEVYLGHNSYGVGRAAQTYFGRPAKNLSPAQATLLAGLPQAPSALNPDSHYHQAKTRQWEVLESMVSDRLITLHTAHRIYSAPLNLVGS
ncbi:MAG: transglycosylase domain-containing protein [Firmicutes bacterium]|jgi:penicillin-binding protein 1A|nr:transglycosylase domain-containing protein [Bacillota bacterium]MCL5972732.1 transglycosylase domain-containing protein [Bacillota bacterium]